MNWAILLRETRGKNAKRFKLIAGLVNAGHTSVSVCDKIHEHYKGTMSSMMDQIRRDIHNKNLHPDLKTSNL